MELPGLTRHVLVLYLINIIPCLLQVKLTDTLPDFETTGYPIEAMLFGLLCVRHSAPHFVSTHFLARPVGQHNSKNA
jgi:hypothetical protein